METAVAPAVVVINKSANGPFVFVCEHASNRIPVAFNHIGISKTAQQSHAGWDIGALELAKALSNKLNSPLVASTVSRLVYDCNRAPDSVTAIVSRSETEAIHGNQNVSQAQRLERVETIYQPFSQTLSSLLDRRQVFETTTALVTIHSFTPVFHDQVREVELGVLHDNDSNLADKLLSNAAKHTTLKVERNQPYGPTDDVTHTLLKHAIPRKIANVMLEIRNDLLLESKSIMSISDDLCGLLTEAVNDVHNKQSQV